MPKDNEFDALFGNTPDVKAADSELKSPAVKVSPELKALAAVPEATSVEDANEFENVFSPEGHVVPADNALSAKDVATLSAAAGAVYGAVKAKPRGDNIVSRGAERVYGAPKGSLAEMQGLREPALPPTAGQAAKAVAARYSGPFEVGAETHNRLPAGSTGTMPFNYAKSAGLTDIEAGLAKDMTKQSGGAHDLVNRRRMALEQLSRTNPTFVENPSYSGLMLDTSAGSGPRGAPRVPVPTVQAPAVAPLSDIQRNIERANTAYHGAQRGLAAVRGGVGSGLTALQAYGMAGDMAKGETPSWQDVASLAGGPMATFGGKVAGPLGMALQVPLAFKDRERIAREMSMGDVAPASAGFTGAEMMQPAFSDLIDPRSAYPGQGRTR